MVLFKPHFTTFLKSPARHCQRAQIQYCHSIIKASFAVQLSNAYLSESNFKAVHATLIQLGNPMMVW